MKEFPIPVHVVGAGSHVEEEDLQYMSMPQGMATFRAPILPEPEDVVECVLAHKALRTTLEQLSVVLQEGGNRSVDLHGLLPADLALINSVLGEGEVSAIVTGNDATLSELRVQESVFAGVWRVIKTTHGQVESDTIELGYIPQALKEAARQDVRSDIPKWQGELPPNVSNAPLLLTEIEDQVRRWRPAQAAYVINLTLLPMSNEDIGFMDHHLGTGRVLILSRGYGNCRITNTCCANTWRVVYYNSQDAVILNTVEISELPEVAQAAREDLEDSHERLKDVLEWVEGA